MLIDLIKRKKELEGIINKIETAFHQHTGRLLEIEDLIRKLETQASATPDAPQDSGQKGDDK